MSDLKAIRGNKPKALSEARILQCSCGCRTYIEMRTGVAVDKNGKVVHRGTLTRICAHCKKPA